MMVHEYCQYLHTALGWLHIQATDQAITAVSFADRYGEERPNELTNGAAGQLKEYFEEKRTVFDLPLQLTGTDFQQMVWLELQRIPYGAIITYQELARRLGDEKCIRAAAHALAVNRFLIVIPCHRVVGSNGQLTGYAGGLWRKQKLLELEGSLALQPELPW